MAPAFPGTDEACLRLIRKHRLSAAASILGVALVCAAAAVIELRGTPSARGAPALRTHSAHYQTVTYRLFTHCGIQWAQIRGTYWKPTRALSDGNGNPPVGWGNPYQAGALSFTSANTAVFRSVAGSVTFHRTALTRPPVLCS